VEKLTEAKKVQGNIDSFSSCSNTWSHCLIISEAAAGHRENSAHVVLSAANHKGWQSRSPGCISSAYELCDLEYVLSPLNPGFLISKLGKIVPSFQEQCDTQKAFAKIVFPLEKRNHVLLRRTSWRWGDMNAEKRGEQSL
jgi:hypothetical protein